jgi:hypothetical protein
MNRSPAPEIRQPSVDRRWALVAIVVVVVLLVGAVGVYAVLPRGAGPAPGSPSDLSPYDQLRAQIGPNGEVTKEMALEAFSLAIAPLPGVTVPTGAPANSAEQSDATFAVLWILPFLDQLTSDQRVVVDRVMTPDPNAPSITPAALGPRVILADTTTASQYLDTAEKYENEIASELGRQLTTTVTMQIDPTQVAGHDEWFAYSEPTLDFSKCMIHVEPKLQAEGTSADVSATMAHEMFHCFQFDWARQHGFLMAKENTPDWLTEGSAEWVGETLGGPSPTGDYWWTQYLSSFGRSLFARDYDAVGFYQHMAEAGIDPWHKFDSMFAAYFQTTSSGSAYDAGSANEDSFLNTWSSGGFRDESMGQDWNASAPWHSTEMPDRTESPLAPTGTLSATAAPIGSYDATNSLLIADVAAEIAQVEPTGHVRLHAGQIDEPITTTMWLCFDQNSCQCPPGQTYNGPSLEYVNAGDSKAEFGLTGGLDGAKVKLTGHKTKEFCEAAPTGGQKKQNCAATCPDSNGDPHMKSVNGYRYSFQAAGEFVLVKDANLEIQARQEPYTATHHFTGTSINTAIAARDNGHVVGVYETASGLGLHVDGQVVNSSAMPDLGAGAAVKQIDSGYEIDFPDGTVLSTISLGQYGINAIVQPSDTLRTQGMGLLGVITPGGLGVPALPDGSQLPDTTDFTTRHDLVYGQFADAWRITDATSLFDYDPGKSTATYTDRSFPTLADDQELSGALASPDPNAQAAAQSACGGITDPELASDCQYDVFATGESGFAQQYALQQSFYNSQPTQTLPPQTAPPQTPQGSIAAATGVLKITDVQSLDGSAIGPDNTLYVAISDSSGAPSLLAVDPITAGTKANTSLRASSDIHYGDGSVWVAGQATDANGQHCSVTRYDPQTLASQGDFAIPCASGAASPHLYSMGDSVWFVDAPGTSIVQIDPSTNAPGKSVPLPQLDGCCKESQGAIFCYCGNSDEWRLTDADSAFVDLGSYSQIYPAGTGFWAEEDQAAVYVNAPGGSAANLPLDGRRVVGGDPTAVYLQDSTQQTALERQLPDGSAPVTLANAPVVAPGTLNETDLDYGSEFPWFATPSGYLHLWVFRDDPSHPLALWEQWAPLP